MKKLYLITIFTSIFIFINIETTFAQWTTQTSPLGLEILGKMQFVSATEGWIACGGSGNLLHTTNAGVQWNVVTPFPADTSMSNPSDVGLTMSWPNATHGWAIKTYGSLNDPNGATMYQTVNGGTNWTKKDFPKLVASVTYSSADLVGTWQVHALFIDNPNDGNVFNGWAYGSTTIASDLSSSYTTTNNQGQTSTHNSTTPFNITSKGRFTVSGTDMDGFMSADKNLMIITQTDGSGGYNLIIWQKVNPSTVYTTADMQGTWELHSIQTQPYASWIYGTTVMDATGNGTTTVITANGPVSQGFSGSMSSTGIITSAGSDYNGFMSADKQTIYITQSGVDGLCNLSIMQKKQNAITYSAADMTGIWQVHGLSIGSSSAAWLHCQYKINSSGSVSVSNIMQNNDPVSDMTSSISIAADGTLTSFSPSSHADGFLSIDKTLGINTLTDGSGAYYLGILQKDLTANGDGGLQVQFADNNTGWASVYNSLYGYFLLYKTTNGGTDWTVINGVANPVGGFYYFVDALNGWMFGASASTIGSNYDILHTTDGGLSWTTQVTNVGLVKAIYFSDVLHGWIVGRNALLMKTIDGGANWTTLSNTNQNPEAQFRSVYALNANVCYFGSSVSGSSGEYILKTTDAGNSWTAMQVPFQYSVFNVVFWDENNGWISGDYGEIAHYSNNTGIQNPLSNDKSESVYPNPVIDFINIKGESAISNAKIYDISGNCVLDKLLENGNKIDVRKLPAGIYFIKLPDLDNSNYIRFIKK
ncbi:YCF48-related protein [Flavobacterium sp. UBA6031]|uniref:YCF48-related protein n=1 Tax=Flavobacterium sp. UBA6031 TaxID=1946551 RepID=UPI0025BE1EED|nr:YCF48-related protein [Flavobacterium sp. UBA6031]